MPRGKRLISLIDVDLPAGATSPASANLRLRLGQHGVNAERFCQAFNAATQWQRGEVIAVQISVFDDRSCSFAPKLPPEEPPLPAPVPEASADRGDFRMTKAGTAPVATTAASRVTPGPDTEAAVSSWQAAEALAGWHMRAMGFAGVEVTPAGADGGLDVRAQDAAAQVKHYALSPVGAPAVQQLRGAAPEGSWALFYSLSGYTRSALEFADRARVALFRYDEDANVTAVNEVAHFLLRSREGATTARPESFALEQEVKAVMQQYLDVVASLFMSEAERGLEVAKVTGAFHPVVRAVFDELDRVQTIMLGVHDRLMPVSELLLAAEQIKDAASRLNAALNSLPDSLRPN